MRKMLRYLSKFPFDDNSVMPEVAYKGLEIKTFMTLCEQFAQMAPIIPTIHTELLDSTVEYYRLKSAQKLSASNESPFSLKFSGMTSGKILKNYKNRKIF